MAIAVTMLTRNRAALLRYTLGALAMQDYPKKDMGVCIFDDGSSDETAAIVADFKRKYAKSYGHGVKIVKLQGDPTATAGSRTRSIRAEEFAHLADLRNTAKAWVASQEWASHWFAFDDDLLLPPNAISRLVSHGLPYVAAAVLADVDMRHDVGLTTYDKRILTSLVYRDFPAGGSYTNARTEVGQSGLIPVSVPASATLADRSVFAGDYAFGRNPQGEEIAFCAGVREAGVTPMLDTDLRAVHVMSDWLLPQGLEAFAQWAGVPLEVFTHGTIADRSVPAVDDGQLPSGDTEQPPCVGA